jgi:predicted RND superfamily exporter protein
METKKLIIGAGALVLVIALVAVSVTLGLMASGGSDTEAEIVSSGS